MPLYIVTLTQTYCTTIGDDQVIVCSELIKSTHTFDTMGLSTLLTMFVVESTGFEPVYLFFKDLNQ